METLANISIVVVATLLAIAIAEMGTIWRWLIGSLRSYFLFLDHEAQSQEAVTPEMVRAAEFQQGRHKIRTRYQRSKWSVHNRHLTIEVSWGLFRRKSAIYRPSPDYSPNWRITRSNHSPYSSMIDVVCLESREPLNVETALRLINTYPSLRAMLDRIAELEGKRERWQSLAISIHEVLQEDRKRHKSQLSEAIRAFLDNWSVWAEDSTERPSIDELKNALRQQFIEKKQPAQV